MRTWAWAWRGSCASSTTGGRSKNNCSGAACFRPSPSRRAPRMDRSSSSRISSQTSKRNRPTAEPRRAGLEEDSTANQSNAAAAIGRIHRSLGGRRIESKLMQLKIEKLIYGGGKVVRPSADEHATAKTVIFPWLLKGAGVGATAARTKTGVARLRT